jgi:hypothetical protein
MQTEPSPSILSGNANADHHNSEGDGLDRDDAVWGEASKPANNPVDVHPDSEEASHSSSPASGLIGGWKTCISHSSRLYSVETGARHTGHSLLPISSIFRVPPPSSLPLDPLSVPVLFLWLFKSFGQSLYFKF